MNIHYNPLTGEIVAYDTNDTHNAPSHAIPGCAILNVAGEFRTVDVSREKVEGGRVVQKTASERFFYNVPAEHEIRAARYAELTVTDWTDSAGHLIDKAQQKAKARRQAAARKAGEPVEPDDEPQKIRAEWQKYRQALRDLGALSNPVEMIEAWPLRPDGTDAIALLRARI